MLHLYHVTRRVLFFCNALFSPDIFNLVEFFPGVFMTSFLFPVIPRFPLFPGLVTTLLIRKYLQEILTFLQS